MRFLKPLLALALVTALALGTTGFVLKKRGYFEDSSIARRTLEKQGKTPVASEVHQAAAAGDLGLLRLLSRAKADFQSPDETGKTALHFALNSSRFNLLPLLEAEGCDPDARDDEGNTPLSILLEQGEDLLATSLIAKGASPDFTLPGGELALPGYYGQGRLDLVAFLLDNGASPDSPASDSQPLLAHALRDNRIELANNLLGHGATADILVDGEPIVAALLKNWRDWRIERNALPSLCGNLLLSGASAESALTDGRRPLQLALADDLRQVTELLLPRSENVTGTLWLAINSGDTTAVQALLAKGAPTGETLANGETPLTHSIRHDNLPMVNALLSHGADPNQSGPEDQPALFMALALGRTDCAMAMINHENHPDFNALMADPVSSEFRELFGTTTMGQFDWYCRNETGVTPLMAAVMLKNLPVAERLLEIGVDKFQGTNPPGVVYPIQMAAVNGDVKMQQLLLGVPYDDDKQERNFIIDLSEQKVRYYKNGELVKTSSVSTGRSGFRTPTGNFVITDKNRHHRSNIYNEAEMPYFQRFSCKAIGFHEGYTGSAFASHGCIRLPQSTAQFFWKEAKVGDRVTIQD